jgi:hypothetical protein
MQTVGHGVWITIVAMTQRTQQVRAEVREWEVDAVANPTRGAPGGRRRRLVIINAININAIIFVVVVVTSTTLLLLRSFNSIHDGWMPGPRLGPARK